jgi:hypothetical protein
VGKKISIGHLLSALVDRRDISSFARRYPGHCQVNKKCETIERREFQRIVPQAMTIGAAEDPPREEEALPIAAGGAAIAPHLGRVQGRDSIDQIGQGGAEGVFMEIPVGDALDIGIGDVIGEAGHRIRPEVTAIGHDGGHDLADLIRGAGGTPAHREEMLAPVQVIIHGDQQLGQANGRDLVAKPSAEARNARFDVSADRLGGIGREVPALVIHGHRGIGRKGGEEAVIRCMEALR